MLFPTGIHVFFPSLARRRNFEESFFFFLHMKRALTKGCQVLKRTHTQPIKLLHITCGKLDLDGINKIK